MRKRILKYELTIKISAGCNKSTEFGDFKPIKYKVAQPIFASFDILIYQPCIEKLNL